MLTIIEKEINKRKSLICDKKEKIEKANELRAQADKLENEAAAIDENVLQSEIVELEGYLPKPVIAPDDAASACVVCDTESVVNNTDDEV